MSRACRPATLQRWLMFNCVGAMGILLQMLVLLALTGWLGLHYLASTAVAVEAAVLHNFFWHRRWTWSDRMSPASRRVFSRLLRFQLSSGAVSVAGNLLLMRFFVERAGIHYLCANAMAILICSILNFMAGDQWVFRSAAGSSGKGDNTMRTPFHRLRQFSLSAGLAVSCLQVPAASAASLRPATLEAWQTCVRATEGRVARELSSPDGFLASDFQSPAEAARERASALRGEIPIRKLASPDADGRTIPVPGGAIHHWRGCVFIPGVPLDLVLSRVKDPGVEDTRQEDVLESRVLKRGAGQHVLYLKLQRSAIVTVRYDTEHLVRYATHGPGRASSSSVSIRIRELERVDGNRERARPEGHDRGFLWRMNSYWRYRQVSGGVLVECESLTLSRSVPPVLGPLIRPLIDRVARESLHRTLGCFRDRMVRANTAHVAAAEP